MFVDSVLRDVVISPRGALDPSPQVASETWSGETDGPLGIAVVGMAGMFAGSTDTNGFWNTILSGKDEITEVPTERWDPAIYYTPELPEATTGRRTVSKWGGLLRPVTIDPIRSGIPPSALSSIDPLTLTSSERVLNRSLRAPLGRLGTAGRVRPARPGQRKCRYRRED